MNRYQKTGNYLVWTEGEYSDYQWNAFFRVLKDFDFVELIEEWARHIGISFDTIKRFTEEWGEPRVLKNYSLFVIYSKNMYDIQDGKYNDTIMFFPYLLREGYVKEIKTQEYHTSSYGDFELTVKE
jgi:hypothetical protein